LADNPGLMAESLTQLLLERADSAVVSMDERGRITYWNPSAERMFGHTSAQAVGQVMVDLIVPDRLRNAHLRGLAHFLATGEGPALDRRIEMAGLRADRSEFPAEMTLSALPDGSHWTFHAFIRDISERKRDERGARTTGGRAPPGPPGKRAQI
jgi:PAS domain S-box-containing protein